MESSSCILTAGQLLYGDELMQKRDWGLIIYNKKIVEVGPLEVLKQKAPEGKVLDYGNDCTILPGLIDCHNHLAWDCSVKEYMLSQEKSEAELTMIGIKTAEKDISSGVTSSRYMGDRFFLDLHFRDFIKENIIAGPKVIASGIGVRASSGHGYIGMPFDGVEEITRAVRRNILKGADWIKFYATGSFLNQKNEVATYYSTEEIFKIVEIAHSAGLPSTCHCVGGKGLTDSVNAGIDCLEHVYFIKEEEIEHIHKAGTWVCLTMSEFFSEKPMMPAGLRDKLRRNRTKVAKCMTSLIASGVPFVLGTDGMHGQLGSEAVYAVEMGASNLEALKALTIRAAQLLGNAGEIGSIDTGKVGDVVVVKGDPVDRVDDLMNVCAVFQDGVLVSQS